jgi:hypothetical protein
MTDSGRPLRDALDDYLALRRTLGFRLATAGRLLGQFVSWLEARGASTITTADALAWRRSRPGHRRPGRRSGSPRSAGSPPTCTAPTRRCRFPRPD